MITLDQFKQMIPTNKEPEQWFEIAKDLFEKYNINTNLRIAGFMAQCAHESMDFTRLEENLNYKEETLLKIFPRYFGPNKRSAAEYARNPEKIANYVYMDEFRSSKMGNTQPGDGWRFRGRGIKQLTGRDNYTAFAKTVGKTAEEAAEYLETKQGAFESACWFWKTNNIEKFADADDITGMTKRINGGTIGIEDRTSRYNKAKAILEGKVVASSSPAPTPATPSGPRVLKKGMNGSDVKELQRHLGLTADGAFGPGTESAVKAWQQKNGLTADGIVGPETLSKILKK